MNLTDYSEIQGLLKRHNFRFSKSLGQNFLTSSSVVERIADSALLDEQSHVLEIGPGIGCLTRELCKRAGKVTSIEADKSLMPILSETLAGCENAEVIFADALKTDLREIGADRVCANLPYSITSPILTAIIKAECFKSITVMIQREVAERICAPAGDANYSAFGIFVQWNCTVEKLFDVPPDCFVPQPKVTSSVVRLTARKDKPAVADNEELMFRIIRSSFNMRRKTLVNALASGIPELGKDVSADILAALGFDTKIRGEVLSVGDFAIIANKIDQYLNDNL